MNICESVASPQTERVSGIENPLQRHQSDCSNSRVHTVLQCMVIPRSWSRPVLLRKRARSNKQSFVIRGPSHAPSFDPNLSGSSTHSSVMLHGAECSASTLSSHSLFNQVCPLGAVCALACVRACTVVAFPSKARHGVTPLM